MQTGEQNAELAIRRADHVADIILQAFDRHYHIFLDITRGAKQRFVDQDWVASSNAIKARIDFYTQRVAEACEQLKDYPEISGPDTTIWKDAKLSYIARLYEHKQAELAETFYNSVCVRLVSRRFYDNDHIFVRPCLSVKYLSRGAPAYHSFYPSEDSVKETVQHILSRADLGVEYEDIERDSERVAEHLQHLLKTTHSYSDRYQIQVLNAPFYRNKAAYIVGRIINGTRFQPFVLPLLHNQDDKIFVDGLIHSPADINNLFSFARAYFMVDTEIPSAVVSFLSVILPSKTTADLYMSLGLQKQGKTEFYRDFLYHLEHSSDQLIEGRGTRGMVMTVFTLPSYPFVFKVINDKFAPPKRVTRKIVKEKYRMVKMHDRVGRMADTLEFSDVAFPLDRFTPEMLKELKRQVSSSIEIEGDDLVFKHVYIERRMEPLNLYLDEADEEQTERAIKEYGNAIKEMAAANIFPGDLLLKNFGVTENGRVVFYDYDEIERLVDCNFRKIPPPQNAQQMMAATPWYSIDEKDVFPEEFITFFSTNKTRKAFLLKHHADLLEADFWKGLQETVKNGVLGDVFPYAQESRFERIYKTVG